MSIARKPMPLVARFIAEFEELTPIDRTKAIGEMAGFCVGYQDGRYPEIVPVEWVKDHEFDDADGEPQVQSEAGAATLAETMTDLEVKPHRGEGADAPAPKGWS
jgi:hypothetical protein